MIRKLYWSSCSSSSQIEIFWTDSSKKSLISNFMKIRPVGAELFLTDRQTDMTKLIIAFCNFANPSKNGLERGSFARNSL